MGKPRLPKPEGAKKWGVCPECKEEDWLYEWEGTYDDPNCLWCEGCIDEAHASQTDFDDVRFTGIDEAHARGHDADYFLEEEIDDDGYDFWEDQEDYEEGFEY